MNNEVITIFEKVILDCDVKLKNAQEEYDKKIEAIKKDKQVAQKMLKIYKKAYEVKS